MAPFDGKVVSIYAIRVCMNSCHITIIQVCLCLRLSHNEPRCIRVHCIRVCDWSQTLWIPPLRSQNLSGIRLKGYIHNLNWSKKVQSQVFVNFVCPTRWSLQLQYMYMCTSASEAQRIASMTVAIYPSNSKWWLGIWSVLGNDAGTQIFRGA